MGKKGALLREQKKNQATYTITGQWLEEHDKKVIAEYRKDLIARMRDEAKMLGQREQEKVDEKWAAIKSEFATSDVVENFNNLFTYVIAISCRVLVEHFGWKPIRKSRRVRLERFAETVVEEMDRICSDPTLDVQGYAEETYRLYGVKFVNGEVEE